MKVRLFILCVLALALCPVFAQAETIWLDYTDQREPFGCDPSYGNGDIYSMRFTPQVDADLMWFGIYAEGEGSIEVHLWPDDNGEPDMTSELVPPVQMQTSAARTWNYTGFSEEATKLNGLEDVHLGIVRKTATGAYLCMDQTDNWEKRAKSKTDNGWEDNLKDWFVKLRINYTGKVDKYYFSDVTDTALNPDALGSRVAWGDYNNDGYVDLLYSGKRLYHNNGDGTFTDISEDAGISELPSNGGQWADFDNDGDLDYFAQVNSLEQYDRFMKNNGDGTFTDITDSAITEDDRDFYPSEGAGWGDYNKDGFLDLYLANYEMPESEVGTLSVGTPDKLYRNNGDGTFTDVAVALELDPETSDGDHLCGRGVNWGDFNDDGYPDIYVSNYRLDPNLLYMNNGDGTFTEVSQEKGVQGYFDLMSSAWGHTIGSAWGDFNNDGLMDLFTANLAHPRFAQFSDFSLMYINNGPPDYDFVDYSETARIVYIETNSDPSLGDWNNDGNLDVFITNVYEGYPPQLYRNEGDGVLTEVTYFSGLVLDNGWGAAFADYDNDGDLDLACNRGLFQNNDPEGNWMKVRLSCNQGDPFCVGAKVYLEAQGQGIAVREVISGKGTSNSPPFELHFGLGDNVQADRILAVFPSGKEVTKLLVDANQILNINEDDPSDEEQEDDDDDNESSSDDSSDSDSGCCG